MQKGDWERLLHVLDVCEDCCVGAVASPSFLTSKMCGVNDDNPACKYTQGTRLPKCTRLDWSRRCLG